MKILLLAQVFPPQTGGSGRWLWELYRRLDSMDVHVAAAETPGDATFDAASALPVSRLPLQFRNWGIVDPRGLARYWRAFGRLSSLVARLRPDILHCGKCLPEGLLAVALSRRHGVPFSCYAHGEELTLASTSSELRWLTRLVLEASSQVIANSSFTRQVLTGEWGISPSKVVVMHPGVDTRLFTPAAPDASVRSRLGWTGRQVVLTVGALQKRKGQDTMIRALPSIRASCPNVLYAIAGEGWERAYLEHLVDELNVRDAVQFLGTPADDELVTCYQQCDLFALPNRQIGWDVEGFGMALVEAQACGKPVIAGNSGGTADTLRAGVTGELVDATSPDAVADAVVRLLTDRPRAELMGTHARTWAVERFGWGHMVEQATLLFEGAASGHHAESCVQPA